MTISGLSGLSLQDRSNPVWQPVLVLASFVGVGPLAYAVSLALGFGSTMVLSMLWTGFWGLPWSLVSVPYVSIHGEQLWLTLCASFNVALVAGIMLYSASRNERRQDEGSCRYEPSQERGSS